MSRRNTWLTGAASATALAALIAPPAQAAVPQPATRTVAAPVPVDCPTALPTAEAVDGLTGTGYTVERGTKPAPFTAKVLGRINDGIAPGVDLIMAELDSPALQRSGGVWAGMSGSPVYAQDGRLIGSVSYGLAGSSPIGGITPASALGTLLDGDPDGLAATRARRTAPVRPSAGVARRLARTGEVSLAEATAGFRRLQMPMLVSGASSPSAKKFLDRLQTKSGVPVLAGGPSAPATTAPVSARLAGGDNFAVTLADGDVTFGAVGTTTYTCHGRAVAFGHPFTDSGVTSMAARSASAVYVQRDPAGSPFKVANIGPVIGTVDRDRTVGLRSNRAPAPVATRITSTLTRVESGVVLKRTSRVFDSRFMPDTAAFHTMFNIDRVMGATTSLGTARLTATVKGKRANGSAFTLTLGNTFTAFDKNDGLIGYQAGDWLYSTLVQLSGQRFERISIGSVDLVGSVSSKASMLGAPVVRVRSGKSWVSPRTGVRAVAGKALRGRASMTAVLGTARTTTASSITPATWLRGKSLWYSVEAGYGFSDQVMAPTPTTFTTLLSELAAQPRSDEVRVSILRDDGRVVLTKRYRTAQSVTDFNGDWALSVR